MNKNLIETILRDYMSIYGGYIITGRALPDLFDGLKPVHRRILFSMFLNKNYNFTKSANIEGNTMKLHPHGGSYGSMVNMVQKERQQIPLITGKGSYGSFLSKDLEAAAARYTEAKLNEISKEILNNTKDYIVDFRPNYDGTIQEPTVLATNFPLVLFNPNSGIALGMSSSIGSFNFNETIDAIIKYLNTNEKTILVPDFPTGGKIIKNEQVFKGINDVGVGTVRIRAKYELIGDRTIEITEFPYGVTKEAIHSRIVALIKSGKIKEISEINDLTGLNKVAIELVCKKNTDRTLLMQNLFGLTPLESTFSFNMNMIYKGLPKVFGVWEVIINWLQWRRECIKKSLEHGLVLDRKKLNILYGYRIIMEHTDEVISIIKNTADVDVVNTLIERFNLNQEQAENIYDMKIRVINKDNFAKKIKEIEELENTIKEKEGILKDKHKQDKLIEEELKEAKRKINIPRRSEIGEVNIEVIKKLKKVKQKEEKEKDLTPVFIVITKDGYVKKFDKGQNLMDLKCKENDYIVSSQTAVNSDELLVFCGTDCYKLPIKNIPFNKTADFGTFIKSTLNLQDTPINISVLNEENKYMLIVYEDGAICKINTNAYRTVQYRRVLLNSLRKDVKVEFMTMLPKDTTIKIKTTKKTVIRKTENLVAKASRATKGARLFNGAVEKFENIVIGEEE